MRRKRRAHQQEEMMRREKTKFERGPSTYNYHARTTIFKEHFAVDRCDLSEKSFLALRNLQYKICIEVFPKQSQPLGTIYTLRD
ncbi:hypothetical protein CHS0354_012580 [Potamilus streckersoni]|uniref:Uncharacterized protein n=1 Tax=Potamilus streckersoni TaxID=2493646 RepID=A0AAE0SXL6_9BIVA|nr:hypothetical protein CHS0354_012580 [Potamilus streckersoni]